MIFCILKYILWFGLNVLFYYLSSVTLKAEFQGERRCSWQVTGLCRAIGAQKHLVQLPGATLWCFGIQMYYS